MDIPEILGKSDEEQFEASPIYVRAHGVLFAGTFHNKNPEEYPSQKKQFLRHLNSSDHVFVETPDNVKPGTKATTFEELVHFNAGRRVKVLEGELNHLALARSYGLGAENYVIYSSLFYIHEAVEANRSFFDYASKKIPGFIRDLSDRDKLDLEYVISSLMSINRPVMKNPNQFIRFGNAVALYFMQVRDANLLGPALAKYLDLKGSKMVVVGAGHVENLLKFLEGEDINPPMWDDFVKAPEIQGTSQQMQEILGR